MSLDKKENPKAIRFWIFFVQYNNLNSLLDEACGFILLLNRKKQAYTGCVQLE
jgi:hypothetical protein